MSSQGVLLRSVRDGNGMSVIWLVGVLVVCRSITLGCVACCCGSVDVGVV